MFPQSIKSGCLEIFNRIVSILRILASILVLANCGGNGDSGEAYTGEAPLCERFGMMMIESPTVDDRYSVSVTPVAIAGYAPLAEIWDACYPCTPTSPGVDVIWNNHATAETGTAFSWVRTYWVPLFGFYYTHEWAATVPLKTGDNLIEVVAMEADDHVGNDCILVTYVEDLEAPSVPTRLMATAVSPSEMTLTWEPSSDNVTTDDAEISYKVYRDGAYLSRVATTLATDTGLGPWTIYCYTVTAVDTALNESSPSVEVCEKTLDQVEPSVPENLYSTVTPGGIVDVNWSPSTDDVAVAGYKVSRDGAEIATVAATSFTDTTVLAGTRYCYTASAFDEAGNASADSYESCTDTGWSITTVDDSGYMMGDENAIAVDSNGAVHIGYHDYAENDLKYATNSSGAWSLETVDSYGSVGEHIAIALDLNGHVHIVHQYVGEWFGGTFFWYQTLKYATNLSGSWMNAEIGYDGLYNSIALDAMNKAHVSHTTSSHDGLRYASNSTGTWEDELIATSNSWSSIAVDTNGGIHISTHQGYPEDSLIYTTRVGDVWASAPVDTEYAGEYSDIALDSHGNVHVVYCKSGGPSYAYNTSGTWQTVLLVDTEPRNGCRHTRLAIDNNDKLHVSYITIDGYLTYLTNDSGSWTHTSLVKIGPLYGWPAYPASIAVDATGKVHISYFGADESLKYMTNR